MNTVRSKRIRRHRRVRARVRGTVERPRLSLFRSNRFLWVQLIDDGAGRTLAAASDRELNTARSKTSPGRRERAHRLGELIARRAKERGVHRAVFDRGGYRYHGLVRAVAEGARAQGLTC